MVVVEAGGNSGSGSVVITGVFIDQAYHSKL
jgi:hypothetical protein